MTKRLGLQHHQGSLVTLGVGCWILDVATRKKPRVCLRCPECAGLYEFDPSLVSALGDTEEPFFCQTAACQFCRFLRFEGWTPAAQFDTSDVGNVTPPRQHEWRAPRGYEAREESGICDACGLYASEGEKPCVDAR